MKTKMLTHNAMVSDGLFPQKNLSNEENNNNKNESLKS